MIKLLEAGGTVAFSWGGLGDGTVSSGLWTAPVAGGGQPLPWYYSYKVFKDYFAPGTPIYKTIVSKPASIEALASASMIMLINKTASSIILSVNGAIVSLSPYQVNVVNL